MSATPPEELTKLFLRSLKNQFYQGREKLYYQEKSLLLQAICWPAHYLDERAVRISADRYKKLLTDVIRTINAHGNLAQVRSIGRYLLHAVQTHMQHHGEDYYEIGKRTRDAIDDIMHGLKPRVKGAEIQSGGDMTVPALAEALRVLAAAKSGPRKAAKPVLQPDLFASAKGLQSGGRDSVRASKASQTFDKPGSGASVLPKPARGDSISRKSLI
jgi:hypothetical protein